MKKYKAELKQADINPGLKFDHYVINYGQDFETYYLGGLNVDFDSKRYWNWERGTKIFSEQDIIRFAELLFDPHVSTRYVTIFTPTRPSDFNFDIL